MPSPHLPVAAQSDPLLPGSAAAPRAYLPRDDGGSTWEG